MKQLALSLIALGMTSMVISCSELNNVWTEISPELAESLPPPSSVAGGTIKIETSNGWETVKMRNNNSGTVMGYDSTDSVKYSVIGGRAYLYLSYTEYKKGIVRDAPRIFTTRIDGEMEAWSESSRDRSASINIRSMNGKKYTGVLNGYLHDVYNGNSEKLRNVPIIIELK